MKTQTIRQYMTAMALLVLSCRCAPFASAQTASGQSDPQAMLVVLKNQPAHQILERISSTSSLQRKLAEDDLRQLSVQPGVPDQMKVDAAMRLLKEHFADTQAAPPLRSVSKPHQSKSCWPPISPPSAQQT